MIYVLIELNGFRQLKKLDNSFTDEIIEYIKRTFTNDGCSFIEQKNSVFIYSCESGDYDPNSFFNNLINLYNHLKSISDELTGFNILVDQLSGDYTEVISRELLYRIFSLQSDDSLYISSDNLSQFEVFGDFKSDGQFFKLLAYHENTIDTEDNIITVLSQTREMDRILDNLTPLINNERKDLIFYYGDNIPGISILAYCIAELIQGKEKDIPWLYLKPDSSNISNINSLINNMDRRFIEKVPSYLIEPELSLWNEKSHFINRSNNILFEEDALIIFRIYLSAYSRQMSELYLPSLIFILDVHEFNDQSLRNIAVILEDLYLDLDLLPVVFSEEEAFPSSFNGFQGKKLHSEPWQLKEDPLEFLDSPISFYHSLILKNKGLVPGAKTNFTRILLSDMGHKSKHLLLIYSLFYEICEKDLIFSFLSSDQTDKYRYENLYNLLIDNGLIYPSGTDAPIFKDINDLASYKFTSEDEVLIDRIVKQIVENPKGCNSTVFEKIAKIYKQLKNYTKEAMFLLDLIDLLIIRGKTAITGSYFERIAELLRMNLSGKSEIELRQSIYLLRAAIFDNKDDFASDVYLRLSRIQSADTVLDSERMLACSEYLFSMYKYKKSLDLAKLALIDIQDTANQNLKTMVNLDLARILMGLKRIDESKDYFKIAKESVDRDKNFYIYLEINSHEAVVNFIDGNFSESLRLVEKSLAICIETGIRDWQLFLLFLNGRILFELGNYKKAIIKFSEGLRHCDIYLDNSNKSILNIWLARTYIYLNETRFGLRILMNYQDFPEALYFSGEGHYFLEEYNNSFEKLELAYSIERDRNRFFCSSNIISWESGYDFIEDRSLVVEGGYGVLFQLIRAFRAYIMSKTNREVEGSIELAKLTREERLSDIDLNNGYYYYLHSLTLPEHTGAEAVDRLTLLSKALRHIQETASNIDDPKQRQMYLSLNYWNSGLMNEGRAHKLI
jgi:hypothetical protein